MCEHKVIRADDVPLLTPHYMQNQTVDFQGGEHCIALSPFHPTDKMSPLSIEQSDNHSNGFIYVLNQTLTYFMTWIWLRIRMRVTLTNKSLTLKELNTYCACSPVPTVWGMTSDMLLVLCLFPMKTADC